MTSTRTAFITGASAGLGTEFARQLSAQGYNLILTARRRERLVEIASSLQSEFSNIVSVIPADLSQAADIRHLGQCLASLPDLEILVNNAGFGTSGRFAHVDPAKLDAMAQVHMTAPILLSRAALPGMLARRRGGIINVASMAGFFPYRGSLYGPSKTFLIAFSQSLSSEVAHSGVHVQALCPGFTYTEFHDTQELDGFKHSSIPKFLWLTSEQVVRHSLRDLERHKEISIPGWQYQLIYPWARLSLLNTIVKAFARLLFNQERNT